jgi:hypothetical protein
MTNKEMWAVGLFAIFFLSSIDVALTSIDITILNPVYGNFSVMEIRISAIVCFVGGLILWYLPKQPKE